MKKIIASILLMGIIISSIPVVKAETKATTIAGLKQELADLKRDRNNNNASKSQTKNSINQKKQAIYDAYSEKEQAENDINSANQKIVESEEKISLVTKETEELLKFYQLTNNDTVFLEYIAKAESISDMSRRAKAIELLTNYNHEQLNYLADLIKENEALKVELANKKIELDNAIVNYNSAISRLDNVMAELEDVGDDINDQIKNQEALIKYYQSICASETQLLSDCVKVLASTGFVRPTAKGLVSSPYGNRIDPLTRKSTSFHYGIDIAGNGMGTSVFAAANGMVAAVTIKSSCGGNIVYIHHNVNGVAYTSQYAHLKSVNVKVGDTVTSNSVIGTIGGGGETLKKNGGWDRCSTGPHLHFSISKGHYLGGGKDGYASFSTFKSRMINPGPYFPPVRVWFYKRF